MEEVCGGTKPYMNQDMLDEEHRKNLNKALHAFDSKKKMGGEEMAAKFKDLLVKVSFRSTTRPKKCHDKLFRYIPINMYGTSC